jgi:hypothetical protein
MKNSETRHSVIPPLTITLLAVIGLFLILVSGLANRIIDVGSAISITIAVGLLTYSVITVLYTKQLSFFTGCVLFVGTLFYVNSAVCYTFGFSPLYFFLGHHFVCSWGFFPNQKSHGLVMTGLGLLIILVAVRSLMASRERKHVEKALEYVLVGLGAAHSVIGLLALIGG